jgi:hypothetical protein
MDEDIDTERAALDQADLGVFVEHLSVARTQSGSKLVLCATISVELDDAAALDLVMRLVGQVARAQGAGDLS